MPKRKIPKCMSTQHPDNATTPFFSSSQAMGGGEEILEAAMVRKFLG